MQTFLCLSDQISISIHPVLISIHQILFSVQTSSAVRPKLDSVWILARPTLLFQSITFPLEKQAARKFCLEIAFPQNILVEKAAKISFYILRLDEETGRQSIRADIYQRRVETRWKMEEEENIFIFLFIVCLEDEGGNMSRSYSIVIISQCSSSYLFPRRRMITSTCFFFIITLKESGGIIFIFLNTIILITIIITIFMVIIISKILMVGEEKQGWH